MLNAKTKKKNVPTFILTGGQICLNYIIRHLMKGENLLKY